MFWWMFLSENIQAHPIAGPMVTKKAQGFIATKAVNWAKHIFFLRNAFNVGISNWDMALEGYIPRYKM